MFQTLLQDVRPSITVVIRSQGLRIFLSLKAAQLVIHHRHFQIFLSRFLYVNIFILHIGPAPYIHIQTINSGLAFNNFTGFGKVNITCTGEGNNATRIYWIRTDKNGNNITLNTTNIYLQNSGGSPSGTWKAVLLDNPRNRDNFPYKYFCVVTNYCCLMKISSQQKMNYVTRPGKPLSCGSLIFYRNQPHSQ